MDSTKQTPDKDTAKQVVHKAKASAKQYDEAFDNLAAFLFEQYRKHKMDIEINRDDKGYIISDTDTYNDTKQD